MYPRRAVIFIEKDVKFLEISRRFTEEVIKTIGCKISLKTKKKKRYRNTKRQFGSELLKLE